MTKTDHRPGPSQADWIALGACPSCGGAGVSEGRLFTQDGHLGSAPAGAPPAPIELRRCTACELVYKSVVAGPALLERLTAAAHGDLWTAPYDYAPEIAAVTAVGGADALSDVIDVGAAGGGFLDTLPADARKSALDIFRFETLKISGEFIKGFLDDPDLAWSGEPYRLVGLFDVAEHLYDPPRAFANLRRFCRPGGLVVIETGDSDTVPRGRLRRWYYLNLLEHHMVWNRASLTRIAERSGFEVAAFERKPHKSWRPAALKERAKAAAFRLAPRLVAGAYRLLGRAYDVPAGPPYVDHMRVILRAV